MKKLETIGNGGKEYKQLAVKADTHEKIQELAAEHNAHMSEIVRFLVDLAAAGKIDFEQGE